MAEGGEEAAREEEEEELSALEQTVQRVSKRPQPLCRWRSLDEWACEDSAEATATREPTHCSCCIDANRRADDAEKRAAQALASEKEAREGLDALRARLGGLENESKDVSRVYEQLKDARSKLREQSKSAETSAKEASDARTKVSELTSQLEQAHSRASIAESERTSESKRADALEMQISELKSNSEDAEQRAHDLQQEVDRLQARLSVLDASALQQPSSGSPNNEEKHLQQSVRENHDSDPGSSLEAVVAQMQLVAKSLGLHPCASIGEASSQVRLEVQAIATALAKAGDIMSSMSTLRERVEETVRCTLDASEMRSRLEHAYKETCSSQEQQQESDCEHSNSHTEMLDCMRDELLDCKAQLNETTELVERMDRLEQEMEQWKTKAETEEANAKSRQEELDLLTKTHEELQCEHATLQKDFEDMQWKQEESAHNEQQLRYERDVKVHRIEELQRSLAEAVCAKEVAETKNNADGDTSTSTGETEEANQGESKGERVSELENELMLERGKKWHSLKLGCKQPKAAVEERIEYLLSFSLSTASTGVNELICDEGLAHAAGALALAVQRTQMSNTASKAERKPETGSMTMENDDHAQAANFPGTKDFSSAMEAIDADLHELQLGLAERIGNETHSANAEASLHADGLESRIFARMRMCKALVANTCLESDSGSIQHANLSDGHQQQSKLQSQADSADSHETVEVHREREDELHRQLEQKEKEVQSERASRQELEQQRDDLEQQQAELEDLLSRAEAAEKAIVGKSNNAEHNVDAKAQEIEALQAKLSDMESEMRALRCSSSGRDDNERAYQSDAGNDDHSKGEKTRVLEDEWSSKEASGHNVEATEASSEMREALGCIEHALRDGLDTLNTSPSTIVSQAIVSDSALQASVQRCLDLIASAFADSGDKNDRLEEEKMLRVQLEEKVEGLCQQLDDLAVAAESREAESQNALQSKLEASEAMRERHLDECKRLQNELHSLHQTKDDELQRKQTELDSLMKQISEQNANIQSLQEELTAVSEAATSEMQRAENTSASESDANAGSMLSKLDSLKHSLQTLVCDNNEGFSALCSRFEELQSDCKHKEEEAEHAASEMEATRLRELSTVKQSLSEAQDDANVAHSEASRLRSELSEATRARDDLHEQLLEAQELASSASHARRQAEDEKNDMQLALQSRQKELSAASSERDQAQRTTQEANETLAHVQRALSEALEQVLGPDDGAGVGADGDFGSPLAVAQRAGRALEKMQRFGRLHVMSIEESRSVDKPCESPPETDMSKKQIESALRQKQREARELHHQLRAADDARLDKEQRIGTLLERCRELEREAAEKASTIEKLHSKIARSSSLSPPSD